MLRINDLKNKKDILFLCQFFYPENVSSATLPYDTADYLAESGYTVGALVGYPKEYTREKNIPIKEIKGKINIHRIKYIQLSRKSTIGRLINYFSFTLSILLHVFLMRNYKSVVVYSNPPILPWVAIIAKKLFGIKVVFVAYDLYPEMGYATNTIKKSSMIDFVMKYINKILYKNSDIVVTLTDEMKKFILNHRKGIVDKQIISIPNWAHEENDIETNEKYRMKDNDQFVVSYMGNMGTCQDMKTLMDAAYKLKTNRRIKFLLVGHGNKKQWVERYVQNKKLENVEIYDFLVGNDFYRALNNSSCLVLSLEKGLKGMCAPSKYYSYLYAGKPIIPIVEKDSYLYNEMHDCNVGIPVEIGNSDELKDVLLKLSNNPMYCDDLGMNAKKLYTNKYAREHAMIKYVHLFHTIIG